MKKKLLITGGSGFIGSHLVYIALKKNYNVLNIDKLTYASRNLNIKNKNYQFKKIDICNSKKIYSIIKKFKPSLIINCAAESHVDRSIKIPDTFFQSNLIGTVNILNSIKNLNKKIRLLQISTDEVFGSLPLNSKKKFNINSFYQPNSPYSASKAAADHAVRAYGETFKIDYVITNCSNNYGPHQHDEKLIPTIIKSCVKKKLIPIYGKGINIRDWIYVEDHAKAVFKVLEKGKFQNTYLIGADQELTNIEMARTVCNYFKKNVDKNFDYHSLITFVTDRKGHDLRYAIDSSKIKRKLNWKAKEKFKSGIEKTIKFYLKKFNE